MRMHKILMLITLRIVLKSIQKFDSHVKFFQIVVSFQAILGFLLKNLKLEMRSQAEEIDNVTVINV